MIKVPELLDCPECGLGLEGGSGPHKLAWHRCTPQDAEVVVDRMQFTRIAMDPESTTAQVVGAMLRLKLLDAAGGDGLSESGLGMLLQGLGKMNEGGETDGTLAEIMGWVNKTE